MLNGFTLVHEWREGMIEVRVAERRGSHSHRDVLVFDRFLPGFTDSDWGPLALLCFLISLSWFFSVATLRTVWSEPAKTIRKETG